MPAIFYNDLMYAGGGSSEIGGASATVLYDNPNDSATFTSITLSDAYDNYDAIVMTGCAIAEGHNWISSQIYYTNNLYIGDRVGFTDDGNYTWYELTNSTTLAHWQGSYYLIRCIVGLKFNSGSSQGGVDYSLNEQDTGLKWIDGREIYQRTLHFSNPVSGDVSIELPLGISDSEMDYVISRESIAERWQGDTFYDYSVDDASPVNQWAGGSFMIFGFVKIDGVWNARLSNGYFIIKNLYLTIRYVKPLNNS